MFTLDILRTFLLSMGINRFFFKRLSENDNAKNQIYLGGSFDVIQNIPFGNIYVEQGLKKPVYKASLDLWWLDGTGNSAPALYSQLIMYPKYPEVRLSGFIRDCSLAPAEYFKEVPKASRTGRPDGRILILAPLKQRVYAYLAIPGSQLSFELQKISHEGLLGTVETGIQSSRDELISLLRDAYGRNPHELVRMFADGSIRPYIGKNAGGYTLEALFRIKPNGEPVPDYKGWELKCLSGSVVTLMTPQPDGGIYNEIGNDEFVRKYGHVTKDGRKYFTGKSTTSAREAGRRLVLYGFDSKTCRITDEKGFLGLVDNDALLASWSFPHIIGHWNTKHNQVCYVRYEKLEDKKNMINYFPDVLLCEKTSAIMIMKAIANGLVYFDPGCKEGKARNQFRTNYPRIVDLYEKSELICLSRK